VSTSSGEGTGKARTAAAYSIAELPIRGGPATAPTNARRTIVAFGAATAFLSFLDRAAISQAAPAISREFHLSPAQMGLVFSAFGITYALGEIPSGWFCDRFGARWLLTRVIALWSLFTAATAWTWNFPSLFLSRLLFGAGESGCFPGLASMFRTWLPPRERNLAEGIKAATARWGAAAAPPLIAALYTWFTWRQVFLVLGLAGILFGVLFFRWYRDDPRKHPSVNAAELALLPPPRSPASSHEAGTPWGKIVRSRSVWALGLQWFAHYYGFYFYITWLPVYLYKSRGLDLRQGAVAAGLPLFAAGLGSLFAGWALSALTTQLGSTAQARKLLGYLSYGGAAALLLFFTWIANPIFALAAMSLSSFAAEFSGPVSWTTAMDIGGDNVGAVSGFMNTLGQLGGSVAPAVTGLLLQLSGNAWNVAFYTSALIYAAGLVCWAMIDPVSPL
jgi:MFS transporter, ACS family, glucarate transporter